MAYPNPFAHTLNTSFDIQSNNFFQNTSIAMTSNVQSSHSSLPDLNIHNRIQTLPNGDSFVIPMKKVKTDGSNVNLVSHKGNEVHLMQTNQDFPIDFKKILMHQDSSSSQDSDYSNHSSDASPEIIETSDTFNMPPLANANAMTEQQKAVLEIAKERSEYAAFFSKMYDNMLACYRNQLQFLSMLKNMNNPEFAMCWPVLDKVNPLMAGVMMKKFKMDDNTVKVMKRANQLTKTGPLYRTSLPKNKNVPVAQKQGLRLNSGSKQSQVNNNGKRPLEEQEGDAKTIKRNNFISRITEKEAAINQLLQFIVYDVKNTEKETKEQQK